MEATAGAATSTIADGKAKETRPMDHTTEQQRISCLGDALVRELEGTWSIKALPHQDFRPGISLTNHEGGFTIKVLNDWNKEGRLLISGTQPKYDDGQQVNLGYDETLASITVSAKRSSGAIAKDIERRLVPKYREQHATLMARKAKGDAHNKTAYELSLELAKLSGGKPGVRHHGTEQHTVTLQGTVRKTILIDYDGKGVSFQYLGLTADQARDFAKLIKKWNEEAA